MRSRLLTVTGVAVLAIACGGSDAGITTSVKSQLISDDLVRARNIEVDTVDRVVTLRGEVLSEAEEAQAIELARNTDGVANVVDEIEVIPAEPAAQPISGVFDDAGTTAEIKSKFLADSDISGLSIDVDTKDHVVTLTGNVATAAEKQKALDLAGQVSGVTSVQDNLKVVGR